MKKFLAFVLISFIVAMSGLTVMRRHVSANVSSDAARQAISTTPPIDSAKLTKQLNSITAQYSDLDVGISVVDLGNNQAYNNGETAAYVGASTTKVLTAALFLHQVEQGKYRLDDKIDGITAANQIKAMIEQSDNDAWKALNDKVGRDFLQSYADGLGLDYVIANNSLTTADMATLLQKLYSGKLLSKTNTALLLGHMQKSIRSYLGNGLSADYKVYHKAGWLDDRVMDSAIVTNGTRSYVLVVFSKSYSGSYDFAAGVTMFEAISQAVNKAVL